MPVEAGKPTRLNPEELQKSIDRLTRPHRREPVLKPLIEKRTINEEQLQKHIKHLYDDSLAHRQTRHEEVARQMQAEIFKNSTLTTPQLDASDEERLVHHLYEESIQRKEKNFADLYQKTATLHAKAARKLTPEEGKKLIQHLYNDGMQRERDKHIALYEKFVVSRRAQATRLPALDLKS